MFVTFQINLWAEINIYVTKQLTSPLIAEAVAGQLASY